MNKNAKIYVAGASGLLGSAVVRQLRATGYSCILTPTHRELDLVNQDAVDKWFEKNQPEYVFLCAGLVGGIMANNTRRGDFLYQNTMIQFNVINAAYVFDVKKLLAVGSSCIYPAYAEQPIIESALLTGELEPTNEPYAISKISALKLCSAYRSQFDCDFISAMPTNLYGPGDTYDAGNSHVIPAMIKKFHRAESPVTVWGSGEPMREFMYVDDCAEALVFLMNNYSEHGHINVGTGREVSIMELARMVAHITGYQGEIITDTTKPDGMMRKRLDVSKINAMGWTAKTELLAGLKKTYNAYI